MEFKVHWRASKYKITRIIRNLFTLNNSKLSPCRIAFTRRAYAVTTFLGPRWHACVRIGFCDIERSIWVEGCRILRIHVVLRNLELAILPVGIVVNSFGFDSVPCVDLINVHRRVTELQCEAITSPPPLSLWVQNGHV